MAEEAEAPIFRPLSADDEQLEATQIESLCMNCHENGTTRLLLSKIPFYKEIVVSSFDCEHCGYSNSEMLSGGKVEDKAVRITLHVEQAVDLNRTVCRSDYTSIKIPELEFEIPPRSQKGGITSIEGIIDRSIEGLLQDQEARREQDPEAADKIEAFVGRLKGLKVEGTSFTFVLEDISGNAFVSNPKAPSKDDRCTVTYLRRSQSENEILGIYEEGGNENEELAPGMMKAMPAEEYSYENLIQDVMQFATNCSQCNAPCDTNMKMTKIPFFKEVVIMATNCGACGHRSNEIKSGGGIEAQGMKVVIKISKPEDFTRDILKSETCCVEIPELELEVGPRALGGRFTTVEGLLLAMKEQICESSAMFADSRDPEDKVRMAAFLKKFNALMTGAKPFTLIMDDPAGNSYVQSMTDSGTDSALVITNYDRSVEQNDELGLTDMKTENYEEDS